MPKSQRLALFKALAKPGGRFNHRHLLGKIQWIIFFIFIYFFKNMLLCRCKFPQINMRCVLFYL